MEKRSACNPMRMNLSDAEYQMIDRLAKIQHKGRRPKDERDEVSWVRSCICVLPMTNAKPSKPSPLSMQEVFHQQH